MQRTAIGSATLILTMWVGYAARVSATPANGFTSQMVVGRFDELSINLHTIPADIWQMRLKTQGQSDVYVKTNKWTPLGTTGWHTHPGPSLIIITSGTVTAYDGDDPSCTPHFYSSDPTSGYPNHLIDPGGGHVHLIRNDSATVTATATVVQVIPAGFTSRIDADQPVACSVQ
jgi:hypothetical protein